VTYIGVVAGGQVSLHIYLKSTVTVAYFGHWAIGSKSYPAIIFAVFKPAAIKDLQKI